MYIELTEHLRCPEDHEEQTYLVLVPETMEGRAVTSGSVGCPVCKNDYAIAAGVARFGESAAAGSGVPAVVLPAADTVRALLGIAGPGGYAVLVGNAARLAADLGDLIEGVHFVGVNAPADVAPSARLSLLSHPGVIPLNSSMARGVVVGAEYALEPWLSEASRLVLRGLRLVVLAEDAAAPGTAQLASGDGMWVGVKE
jgi:hypothetical protein